MIKPFKVDISDQIIKDIYAPERNRFHSKSPDNIKEDNNEESEKQIDIDILTADNKSE